MAEEAERVSPIPDRFALSKDYCDPDMDGVIAQMKEDYATGKITLERFEEYVYNRLQGRTPVNRDGMPLYYEDGMLNGTGLYYVA